MRDDPLYGRVAPELGWVPAPSYLMRRRRVLDVLGPRPRGALLEIGCGAGALLVDLHRMGFEVGALETSPEARSVATRMTADLPSVSVRAEPGDDWTDRFDYVLALEVLEHIEDDAAALGRWAGWVRPGGLVVLSVPAHQDRWGASDVWAGHHRRYGRRDLAARARSAGLSVVLLESYGAPLTNLIHPVRNRVRARQMKGAGRKTTATRTAASGVDRSTEARLFPLQDSLPGRLVMRFFLGLQPAFRNTDRGNGFLMLARRDGSGEGRG